jgi:hypothetical protein
MPNRFLRLAGTTGTTRTPLNSGISDDARAFSITRKKEIVTKLCRRDSIMEGGDVAYIAGEIIRTTSGSLGAREKDKGNPVLI